MTWRGRMQPNTNHRVKNLTANFWRAAAIAQLVWAGPAFAQPSTTSESVVTVSIFWSQTGVKPGGEINLGVVLDIKPGYHINANTAKDPFIPIEVQLVGAPEEVRGTTALFPAPESVDFDDAGTKKKIPVFSGRVLTFMTLAAASARRAGFTTRPSTISRGDANPDFM